MKRLIALLLTLAMLLAAIPAALADSYATATVKGGWLRLRESASPYAKTISAYFTGTTVTLLGSTGEWYRVLTPDGKTGYMHADFLTLNGLSGGTANENIAGIVTSGNGRSVWLRSGPSKEYGILRDFAVGTPLTVLSTGESWSQVRINGITGYMMNEFIKRDSTSIQGGYTAYVVSGNGKSVVLRSGPSKQYDALATYAVGQQLRVLSYGSTWCQVSVNGLVGHMMTEFISTTKPNVSGSATSYTSYTAYVTSQNGKGVRMRMGAGKLFPTLATYSVGTQVTVLEYDSDWCRIRVGANTGYMMTEFLTTRAPSLVTEVRINAANAKPGDTLWATVTPSSASVTISWVNDRGDTLGYGESYTVQSADAGRKIRASVTGSGSTSGTAVSGWATVSGSYAGYAYELQGVVISDATPDVGQTLTATLTPDGATANISWFRDNGVFVGSGTSYKVRSGDAGHALYVWAEGNGYTSGSATSALTAAVAEGNAATVVLQAVTISDTTPEVGDTLTVTFTPMVATAALTWRSSAGHILGYGDSYTVTAEDVGSSIYVYANGSGSTSGSVVSSLTSKVQEKAPQLRVESVTLSDTTPTVGQTLYVTLQPQTASATYTWYRDDDKILSTSGYYTVRAEDAGHTLYVWAEGANGTFGGATSVISQPVEAQ